MSTTSNGSKETKGSNKSSHARVAEANSGAPVSAEAAPARLRIIIADSEAIFRVDGVERLRSPAPPRGPLALVIWIDNQYGVASREGKFGFGLCSVAETQWLEVEGVQVQPA